MEYSVVYMNERFGLTTGAKFEGERVQVPILEAHTVALENLTKKSHSYESFITPGNPIFTAKNISLVREKELEIGRGFASKFEQLTEEQKKEQRTMKMYATVLESVFVSNPRWFGEPLIDKTEVTPTLPIDDLVHGVDLVVSRKGNGEHGGDVSVSGIDITFGGFDVVRKKIERLIRKLQTADPLELFFFKRDDFKGSLTCVPLFIVGTDFRKMKDLVYASVQGDLGKDKMRHDAIQLEIVEDIVFQGDVYIHVLENSIKFLGNETPESADITKRKKVLSRIRDNYVNAVDFYKNLLKMRRAMQKQGSFDTAQDRSRFTTHLHGVLDQYKKSD
jgi:hypothetical protein